MTVPLVSKIGATLAPLESHTSPFLHHAHLDATHVR